ncbi:hypothetical protein EVS81_07325 [Leucobacter triazinivorans]|uniref:Uncharacterized protein n=1 Tax=Leucobacter triazinivorans TaxID=1784719 RepID=A0A4P6KEN1_9MICO|nr:hypothetical protein EVS81_07325 [Leucobacter triazinivorans]
MRGPRGRGGTAAPAARRHSGTAAQRHGGTAARRHSGTAAPGSGSLTPVPNRPEGTATMDRDERLAR